MQGDDDDHDDNDHDMSERGERDEILDSFVSIGPCEATRC